MSAYNPFEPPDAPLADPQASRVSQARLRFVLFAICLAFAAHGLVMLVNLFTGITEQGMILQLLEPLLFAVVRVVLPGLCIAFLALGMPLARWVGFAQLALWLAVFLLSIPVHAPHAFSVQKVSSGMFSQATLSRQVLLLNAATLAAGALLAWGIHRYVVHMKRDA